VTDAYRMILISDIWPPLRFGSRLTFPQRV